MQSQDTAFSGKKISFPGVDNFCFCMLFVIQVGHDLPI
jgi:hypothetical protein